MLDLNVCSEGVMDLQQSQIDLGAGFDDLQELRAKLFAIERVRKASLRRACALEAKGKNHQRLGERTAHRHRIEVASELGLEVHTFSIASLPRQIRRQMARIDLDSCRWPVLHFRDQEWIVIAADRLGLTLARLPQIELSSSAAALFLQGLKEKD